MRGRVAKTPSRVPIVDPGALYEVVFLSALITRTDS
jgi:hypothetical protein